MAVKALLSHCRGSCPTSSFFAQMHITWVIFWVLVLQSVLPPRPGVLAEVKVQCFDCNWQSSTSHLNSETVQDYCLPEHFRRDKVNTISCSQGCMTTSMYEGDLGGPVTTLELRGGTSEDKEQVSSLAPNRPPLSFFTRGCPNGDITRKEGGSGCEEKTYQHVFREECFCRTPLCNGGHPTRSPQNQAVIFLILGALLTRNMNTM
ncbi:uncharacterized protein LOC110846213 [Folsomia candida]|uniref:uncharacterized protein LOC110846213 n=1 Tax=Folsomia candida TaxID=158441 RepID=UPI00160516E5|nr:uncharacterized protein LOC110846213 [Folsomia candida]